MIHYGGWLWSTFDSTTRKRYSYDKYATVLESCPIVVYFWDRPVKTLFPSWNSNQASHPATGARWCQTHADRVGLRKLTAPGPGDHCCRQVESELLVCADKQMQWVSNALHNIMCTNFQILDRYYNAFSRGTFNDNCHFGARLKAAEWARRNRRINGASTHSERVHGRDKWILSSECPGHGTYLSLCAF